MKKSKIKEWYEFICNTIKKAKMENIDEYSSQCSYYTILSFIPFLILLLTLIQYTGVSQEAFFNVISNIIPKSMNDIVIKIVKEVYSKSLGTISISIIFTIWPAGKGLYALSKGLHKMYNNKEDVDNTNYFLLRLRAVASTIIFIVFLVLGLVALVFSNSLLSIIQQKFGILENFSVFGEILVKLFLLCITIILFACVYKFMPKHKVSFKSQLYGATFGAIALNIVSFVFAKYLDIFKNFSITYGSLTTLMLVMMWTYSCFYTVFLGAKLNKLISKTKFKGRKKKVE